MQSAVIYYYARKQKDFEHLFINKWSNKYCFKVYNYPNTQTHNIVDWIFIIFLALSDTNMYYWSFGGLAESCLQRVQLTEST